LVWNQQNAWGNRVAKKFSMLMVQIIGPVKATKILKLLVLR
jgi:hypothetical protein